MNIPKLDNRDANDVLAEIKNLAKQYVPEWNFDENDPDFGVIFSKIFANMFETSITKYNRSLYNYYMTFLNLLGIKFLPSIPATGMITVDVTKGSGGTYIDMGTNVYAAADNEEGRVFYRTQDVMYAIDNKINSIYMTDGKNDIINNVYEFNKDENNQISPFRIYDSTLSENLQKHIIYFKSDYIFKTGDKSDIRIQFYDNQSLANNNSLADIFIDKDNVKWQYYKEGQWNDIKNISKNSNGIRLQFDSGSDVCKVNSEESYYIRCIFNKIPKDELSVTSIMYASQAKGLSSDILVSDSTELAKNDFFPFGEQYNLYTDFYVASSEAFSKKGAKITLKINMKFLKAKINTEQMPDNTRYRYLMTDMDFANPDPEDVQIEKVAWEYWNGFGWSRLYQDDTGEEFFQAKEGDLSVKEIVFICPDDMQSFTVGPAENIFIRARITKIKNAFNVFADYITPYINSIDISYDYLNEGCKCTSLTVESNLKTKRINLTGDLRETLLKKNLIDKPTIYMCFDQKIDKGPVRILLDLEEGFHKDNPSLVWEYYAKNRNGAYEWKNLEIMDPTENLSHSGVITIIGKKDFVKSDLFGKSGYFIRIVNHDSKYSTVDNVTTHPIINGIYLNTIGVEQMETRSPEYFSIDLGEENKICNLSSKNISNARVWVNEFEHLSVVEEEKFINDDGSSYQKEYDEKGRVKEIWVEWKPIHSIAAADYDERVFEIDYNKGQIIFGNGRYGKIPCHQNQESIKVQYNISSGSVGNVPANGILGFSSSVPYISKVTNLKPMVGGIDMETVDFAAERMSYHISDMDRVVTLSDFENSIAYNDRNISKVKCIPHVNNLNEEEIGTVSIAVLPKDYMQGYEKFAVLKKRVYDYIDQKAAITFKNSSKIHVFETIYVEISVNLEIVIDEYNNYQKAYQQVYDKLKKFLDPIEGGFDGNGWKIGTIPRKELIYNYIKMTPHIKWIKEINLFTKVITKNGKKEVDFDEVKNQKFTVPVFGEPDINMSVE